MDNFIKENICDKFVSCNECRETFEMPYRECCLFACDHSCAVCKKCSNGIYHERFNEI